MTFALPQPRLNSALHLLKRGNAAMRENTTSQVDVAVLVFDLRGSGVVRNALRIAERVVAAGMSCDLVVVQGGGDFRHALPSSSRLVQLGADEGGNRAVATLRAVPALRAYVEARRPGVLFSSGNHVHPLAALALRGVKLPPKLVMRASNDMVHPRKRGWEALVAPALAALARPWLKAMFAAADRIVAVSRDLAGNIAGDLDLQGHRIDCLPNGIDLTAVARQAAAPLDDPWFAPGAPPVIVGIGRLVRQKNFPLLVEAFARLRAHTPARLLILGTGAPAAMARLRAQAERLGVADDVRLAGFCANPFAYLKRADLFVLSSSWEGMSNALLEALACGCPVVATNCPTGTAEVLANGRFGPLVPLDDAAALADAMAWRLARPRASEALMARARAFSLEDTLDGYVRLFAEELGRPLPARLLKVA